MDPEQRTAVCVRPHWLVEHLPGKQRQGWHLLPSLPMLLLLPNDQAIIHTALMSKAFRGCDTAHIYVVQQHQCGPLLITVLQTISATRRFCRPQLQRCIGEAECGAASGYNGPLVILIPFGMNNDSHSFLLLSFFLEGAECCSERRLLLYTRNATCQGLCCSTASVVFVFPGSIFAAEFARAFRSEPS